MGDDIKYITIVGVLLGVVLVGLLFVVHHLYIVRQHRNIVRLNRLRALSAITAFENERQRLAADLHDYVGTMLSAVKLVFSTLDRTAEDQKVIEKGSSLLDELVYHMRTLSDDLMPRVLMRRGIGPAIDEFIDKISPGSNLKITWRCDDKLQLPEDKSIILYRMILEIINNALKHSKGSQLVLELSTTEKKMFLFAADDGIGFDNSIIENEKGLGLLNLMNRAQILGGRLRLDTLPQYGTKYYIEMPLNHN